MASESIAHSAIDLEPIQARGIIVKYLVLLQFIVIIALYITWN